MGFIKDNFLGGAERRAGDVQADALGRGQDFIRTGTTGARGELNTGFGGAEDAFTEALQQALGVQGSGLQDIIASLTGQSDQATSTLQGGQEQSIQALLSGLEGAEGQLNPFAEGGRNAFELQQAQSGALGPEAQAAAFANFSASPEQDFLRSQGEQSISRNAAASGGLGGGALRADLQQFGTGLAAQDFNNQFNRLGQLSQQGQQAATNLGQFGVGTGRDISSVINNTQGNIANNQNNLGAQLAAAFGNSTNNISNLFSNQGTNLANLRTQLGTNLANLLTGQGTNLANLEGGIGQAQAGGILGAANQVRAFEDQQFNRGEDAFQLFGFGG